MKRSFLRPGGVAPAVSAAAPAATPNTSAQSTTTVRAVRMAPGAPNVDITVVGQRAFAALAFKAATTYAAVPADQRNVRVAPAGATNPVVIDVNLNPQAGQQLTVVATGELPGIRPLVLPDDNSASPGGQARVRFVHAAPDAPAVDIAVQGGPVLHRRVPQRVRTWLQSCITGAAAVISVNPCRPRTAVWQFATGEESRAG